MKVLTVVCALWLMTLDLLAQPVGYTYVKQIEILASQVSGTASLSDFPMLVNVTDNDLRTVANGGNVENANGYDIIFTLEDCNIQLDHQIEKYNAATGEYVTWVKIPSLSGTANTIIHMYYGNASVSTSTSTTAVWDANYQRVVHLHDDFNDATSNASHGTNSGSSDIAGKIADGQSFDGGNDFIGYSNTTNNTFTISCWINATAVGASVGPQAYEGSGIIWADVSGCDDDMIPLGLNNTTFQFGDGQADCSYDNASSTTAAATGTWYYLTVTRNGANGVKELFVNGSSETITAGSGTNNLNGNTDMILGGNTIDGRYFNGIIDEARFSDIIRSDDWIQTEFNNQNNPAAFYTVTAQMASSALCEALPVNLINFKAYPVDDQNVMITWQTVSETDNDFFTVERSKNGADWESLTKVAGAGNSSSLRSYQVSDDNPYGGASYYRLRQTDYDGQYTLSPAVRIQITGMDDVGILIYPNPAEDYLMVQGDLTEIMGFELLSSMGKDVTSFTKIVDIQESQIGVDITSLPSGLYLIRTRTTTQKLFRK
ncbi:MAG: DUF2341 domain-containing protein [Cyclobacteriaceae bacterium]